MTRQHASLHGLAYGDQILLVEDDGGVLWADGHVERHVCLNRRASERPTDLAQAVFELCHRRSYTAHEALVESLRSLENREGSINVLDETQDGTNRRIPKLAARAQDEDEANEKESELITGEPVVYGSTIQLRHVASGQWLTLSADFRLVLDQRGSAWSWFCLTSAYKQRCEGDCTMFGDTVCIQVRVTSSCSWLSRSLTRVPVPSSPLAERV